MIAALSQVWYFMEKKGPVDISLVADEQNSEV